jgi:hypothetical protein
MVLNIANFDSLASNFQLRNIFSAQKEDPPIRASLNQVSSLIQTALSSWDAIAEARADQ